MSDQRSIPEAARPVSGEARYVVGQDAEGRWLAVEQHGRGGGIFVSKDAALRYVGFETGHAAEACTLAAEPVGLWHADAAAPGVRRAA